MMTPVMASLPHWASSLMIDFPDDNIPYLGNEAEWREWGNLLIQEPSFAQNNAPSPNFFQEWRDWAFALYSVMQDYNG